LTIANGQKANTNLLAALSVAGASLLGVTIMRTHLRLTVTSGGAAGNNFRMGLIVARTADVGSNVTGSVDANDPEADWMLLDRRFVYGQGTNVSPTPEYQYDIKAKRKMQELDQAYILSISAVTASVNLAFALFARTLVALP
jgi:hypothetical protein